ncbi:lactonase family protein [Agromyces italicus]|uniref:lactonase family protein n=1 Tax=Agromyces italicus TaxID=279572 RepID=UPI0003B71F51|nr:beta-propeller fold lactonase family protein [Agromyces italicus]
MDARPGRENGDGMAEAGTTRFWVGASTVGALGSPARGIRSLDLDADGRWALGDPIDVGPNPMFLAVSGAAGVLGIVHELAEGRISSWTFEGDGLSPFSRVGVASGDPCHLAFTESGELAFAANYSGHRVTVHPLAPDASADSVLEAEFSGTGPNLDRQTGSHPHQVVLDHERDRLLVPDLGADRIRIVGLGMLPEALEHDEHADIVIHPGAGPRHLVVSGGLAVTANELDRTASVIDLVEGRELAWFPIGPDTETRGLGCSAIRLTRGGIVLIGDRDADALRGLRLDVEARTLELVATVATGGRHPRDLELSRDERFALVADQGSDSIAIVALDGEGVPLGLVDTVATPAPACLARVS